MPSELYRKWTRGALTPAEALELSREMNDGTLIEDLLEEVEGEEYPLTETVELDVDEFPALLRSSFEQAAERDAAEARADRWREFGVYTEEGFPVSDPDPEYTDSLHVTDWKLSLRSTSDTRHRYIHRSQRRLQQLIRPEEWILTRDDDQAILVTVVEQVRPPNQHVTYHSFVLRSDEPLQWRHNAQYRANGRRDRVTHETDFGIIEQRDTTENLENLADEQFVYKLVSSQVYLVPEFDDMEAEMNRLNDRIADRTRMIVEGLATDVVEAAVPGLVGKALTAFVKDQLGSHVDGTDRVLEVPLETTEYKRRTGHRIIEVGSHHSADDQPRGTGPELWAYNDDYQGENELTVAMSWSEWFARISNQSHVHSDWYLPVSIELSSEVRYQVRRTAEQAM